MIAPIDFSVRGQLFFIIKRNKLPAGRRIDYRSKRPDFGTLNPFRFQQQTNVMRNIVAIRLLIPKRNSGMYDFLKKQMGCILIYDGSFSGR